MHKQILAQVCVPGVSVARRSIRASESLVLATWRAHLCTHTPTKTILPQTEHALSDGSPALTKIRDALRSVRGGAGIRKQPRPSYEVLSPSPYSLSFSLSLAHSLALILSHSFRLSAPRLFLSLFLSLSPALPLLPCLSQTLYITNLLYQTRARARTHTHTRRGNSLRGWMKQM